MLELYNNLIANKIIRYFIAAGTATGVDVLVYFLCYNYLFQKNDQEIIFTILTAPTLSLIISYTCGLITNFLITKFFVFTESTIHGGYQFLRYLLVAFLILIANFYLMHYLIGSLDWYPTISRAVAAIVIGALSFLVHRSFSFQVK